MYILIPKYGFGVTFPGEARGIFPLRGKSGNFSTRVKKYVNHRNCTSRAAANAQNAARPPAKTAKPQFPGSCSVT